MLPCDAKLRAGTQDACEKANLKDSQRNSQEFPVAGLPAGRAVWAYEQWKSCHLLVRVSCLDHAYDRTLVDPKRTVLLEVSVID